MKCFNCGFRCITKYHEEERIDPNLICLKNPIGLWKKVVAVSKVCNMCGWESYKTKLPDKIV